MPIIQSLLDVDFYKFTMGQLVFKRYREVPVTYAFKNRSTGVNLAEWVDKKTLREELDHVRSLRFNNTEIHYLRGTNEYGDRMFSEEYLRFLGTIEIPDYDLNVAEGVFDLRFSGTWATAIYWETLALAVVSELYYRELLSRLTPFRQDRVWAEGRLRLAEKIDILRKSPKVTFVDFGTRRRFSRDWQLYVDRCLRDELPGQFLGTSSTESAMIHGLVPMGTSAHEMYMVMSTVFCGSDEDIRRSHNRVLQDWWEEYGSGLAIALTDTYGSDFFFRDMTTEQARSWKGVRHDSGDPFAFGEQTLEFYRSRGIDPREKMIVFSDGLDVETILALAERFDGRIKVTFGWGTNLTNDMGFEPLPIVVKVVEANGRGTVKLSDNLAKAIGRPEDVERFKRIFGYTGSHFEVCRY